MVGVLENKVLEPQCSGIAHAACVTGSRESENRACGPRKEAGVVVPPAMDCESVWLGAWSGHGPV